MASLEIDGSEGEGGGQILRSSMALSVLSQRPIRITNIRAGRKKPGLMRQHLTSVRAVAEVCGGVLTGDELESSELTFEPAPPQAGNYEFRIGSAGSATLVLQTVLPILLRAGGPSRVAVEGGTHNDMSPPFDFLDRTFLPFVRAMGATVDVKLECHGFFPAGGGRIVATINPPDHVAGFDLLERGAAVSAQATVLLSRLPEHIGDRQARTVEQRLRWPGAEVEVETSVQTVESPGPGTVCLLDLEFDNVTEVVSAVGRRGLSAEKVAEAVVAEAERFLDRGVPVGDHLADQLLMPLALSACEPADAVVRRGGTFRTGPLTMHTTTHIDIISRFLPVTIDVTDHGDQTFTVAVEPA